MNSLDKHYTPETLENKWSSHWATNKTFEIDDKLEADFAITLPPPNVTGELHMGHALNGTLQDILIRYHRLKGKRVHWQVGSDHAGIGTQIVVEKQLAKDNINKYDLGRDKFLERAWDWTNKHQGRIEEQMKIMGFSADWRHSNFTLNKQYANAVQSSFFELFKQGLVYRGKRLINWCPHCLTSLSDLEVEHKDQKGQLTEIKYKLSPKTQELINNELDELVVATSRPETLFGDVAVAINPKDERYTVLSQAIQAGQNITVILPLVNKEIPVLLTHKVETDFGTGVLKITPAHDFNDAQIAKELNIDETVNIFNEKAKILELEFIPSQYHGLDRFKARELAVQELESQELLGEVKEYTQPLALHDRCGNAIEPYMSEQWFVRMPSLAGVAIDALKTNQVKFFPERYSKTYLDWLENIQDWCISRQLWWGHQIPIFTKNINCDTPADYAQAQKGLQQEFKKLILELDYNIETKSDIKAPSFIHASKNSTEIIFQTTDTEVQVCMSSVDQELQDKLISLGYTQDEDVLDTWFSSALWPFAAQGWENKHSILNKPAWSNVLSTAREIINLWVSRMIYSSLSLTDKLPFSDILIHPVIQTPDGKRMSKSKGNAIDPLNLVTGYGADASRMWYASVGIFAHQDIRFPGKLNKKSNQWESPALDTNRRFLNKLWNATKFVKMSVGESIPQETEISNSYNQYIISRWTETLVNIEQALQEYKFEKYISELENFTWEYCDWYLEISKVIIKQEEYSQETKYTLYKILEELLRAFNPVIPFISEELWNYITEQAQENSINNIGFPVVNSALINTSATELFGKYKTVINNLRSIKKNLLGVSDNTPLNISLDNNLLAQELFGSDNSLLQLARTSVIESNNSQSINKDLGFIKLTVYIPEQVDIKERLEVIKKSLDKKQTELNKSQGMLNNPGFRNNARQEQIDECQEKVNLLISEVSELQDAVGQIEEL